MPPCPHCAELQQQLEDTRAGLRAAISIIGDHVKLGDRNRATYDGLVDLLGLRRSPDPLVHERETSPDLRVHLPPAEPDDEQSLGDVVVMDEPGPAFPRPASMLGSEGESEPRPTGRTG